MESFGTRLAPIISTVSAPAFARAPFRPAEQGLWGLAKPRTELRRLARAPVGPPAPGGVVCDLAVAIADGGDCSPSCARSRTRSRSWGMFELGGLAEHYDRVGRHGGDRTSRERRGDLLLDVLSARKPVVVVVAEVAHVVLNLEADSVEPS